MQRGQPRVSQRGLYFLVILFGLLTILLVAVILPFFAYAFFGAFAGFLVWPLHRRLAPRLGLRTSALLLVLGVYAVLFIPLGLVVWRMTVDLGSVIAHLQEHGTASVIYSVLSEILPDGIAANVADAIAGALKSFASQAGPEIVLFALDAMLGFFIFGFICFYTLVEGHAVVHFIKEVIPLRRFRVENLMRHIELSLDAVFFGVIIVAAIQATLGTIIWWAVGLPSPFFYGAVMFVLSIIPFTGASFVMVPVGVIRLVQGDTFVGLLLILSAVLFIGSIDNFLRPVLVSKFGKTNPAMVVIGLAGGLVAFGLVGMFIGPLVFALWVAVAQELRDEVNHWKLETLKEPPAPEDHVEDELLRRSRFPRVERSHGIAEGDRPAGPAAEEAPDDHP